MNFDFVLDNLLSFGCLPAVCRERAARTRIDVLDAYVSNYIREEIQQEALVKNLESFSRFLEIAGLANGQVTNIANIARDAGVARPTVQGYFQVLIDTLVGVWIPAWKPRAKIKEVGHPKFYFFDSGVVRAVQGRLREPLEREERGVLLETLILHELRATMSILNCGGEISYWRTPSGSEVDFIWKRGSRAVAIEVKSSDRWKNDYGRSLKDMIDRGWIGKGYGVYCGEQKLKDGKVTVLPVKEFMQVLSHGHVLG